MQEETKHMDTPQPWILVLAAGQSRRMGKPKLLLPDETGSPLIVRVMNTVLHASRAASSKVCVVYDPAQPAVERSVSSALGSEKVDRVWNDQAHTGMASSLRAGIQHLQSLQAECAVVVLGDQPELSARVVEDVMRLYLRHQTHIVRTRYRGTPGHPVLFAQALFPELTQIEGDQGGRDILRRHLAETTWLDVDAPPLQDIDTPEDYDAFLRRSSIK
ncbi:nucleotidyltransferase family protein [Alicyclobacillus cycloheptanicus]|uniref:Molybdenum cofactor cytidylyltransferase n=1 Tax=Alicyclobacillus cycloheptanicus TaxID=1457 RepID=A0ABT9XFI6_9BACL|nr:nucleotidyltransferase family protein [Alicyclobacillus cycloheptanicus]MDQ0188506.1 molybdenum cofactor cytidylyltransferase [Alicyclobacillus cycloheptanicus]WDM01193.1 nucleotidyltransferase family protein [Alicyclobacillus cycloheptanicus]